MKKLFLSFIVVISVFAINSCVTVNPEKFDSIVDKFWVYFEEGIPRRAFILKSNNTAIFYEFVVSTKDDKNFVYDGIPYKINDKDTYNWRWDASNDRAVELIINDVLKDKIYFYKVAPDYVIMSECKTCDVLKYEKNNEIKDQLL